MGLFCYDCCFNRAVYLCICVCVFWSMFIILQWFTPHQNVNAIERNALVWCCNRYRPMNNQKKTSNIVNVCYSLSKPDLLMKNTNIEINIHPDMHALPSMRRSSLSPYERGNLCGSRPKWQKKTNPEENTEKKNCSRWMWFKSRHSNKHRKTEKGEKPVATNAKQSILNGCESFVQVIRVCETVQSCIVFGRISFYFSFVDVAKCDSRTISFPKKIESFFNFIDIASTRFRFSLFSFHFCPCVCVLLDGKIV